MQSPGDKGFPLILSNTSLPCPLRQRYTPKAQVSCYLKPHTAATLTYGHSQIFFFSFQWGFLLRTTWPWWEGCIYSKDLGSNTRGSGFWGDSPTFLPVFLHRTRGSITSPSRSPGAAPIPQGQGVRWGKGGEEGAAPPSETQRDVLQPRLHGDAGEGERSPNTSFPTCRALGTSVATHLLPLTWARLTWAGAAGTPRQGAWAPSRSSSARPGGLRAPQSWAEMRVAPWPGSLKGVVAEASCW